MSPTTALAAIVILDSTSPHAVGLGGLIGDRQLRMRARDLVDLAFVAARAANDDPNARWGLNK